VYKEETWRPIVEQIGLGLGLFREFAPEAALPGVQKKSRMTKSWM
jgi:ribosomal protein S14